MVELLKKIVVWPENVPPESRVSAYLHFAATAAIAVLIVLWLALVQ